MFRVWCLNRRDQLAELVATRLVQTNEVGRCTYLLAALTLVAQHLGGRTVALVELGASAGLNLLLDRYHYIAHLPQPVRERFCRLVPQLSQHRPIFWLQAEPRPHPQPRLRLAICADETVNEQPFGSYHPHGAWLDWLRPDQRPTDPHRS